MKGYEMTRKKELEILAFDSRHEIAEKVNDGKRYVKKGTPTVSPRDIADFLRLSAMGHKSLSKYIRASRISMMLKTGQLFLSRLSEMNDLDEFYNTPNANRIYIASFCSGSLESMGMWKMYGGDESESVRLDFNGKEIRACCQKQMPIYEVPENDGRPTGTPGELIPAAEVESWSFHDMVYKYGQALRWNGKTVGVGRCPELRNVWKCTELLSCVKRFGWAAECEVRLVVKLRNCVPARRRIAIGFRKPIEGMEVVLGPVYSKAAKVCRAFAENGLPCPVVRESSYCAEL